MSGPAKSPFSALAPMRDQLPPGEVAPPTRADAAPAATDPIALAIAGKIVVRRERKGRGGKTVTLVQGVRAPTAVLEALARELRRALGCGGSVETGRDGVEDVCLQGDVSDRVAQWLEARGARRVVRSG